MFCNYCGRENPENAKFCSSCGNALTQPVQPYQNQNYYQTPYGQPNYYNGFEYARNESYRSGKNASIVSFVCSLVAAFFSFFVFYGGLAAFIVLPSAIIAIVFGAKAKTKLKSVGAPYGMAIAGIIIGAITLAILVLIVLFYLYVVFILLLGRAF